MSRAARWYAVAAVVGLVAPNALAYAYAFGSGWPFRMSAWLGDIFPNFLGAAFSADAVWTAAFFVSWMFVEGRRRPELRWRLHALSAVLFGVSFALPLYLYAQERS